MSQPEGGSLTATSPPPSRSVLRHPALKVLLGLLMAGGVGYALWIAWHDPKLADFEWEFHPLPIAIALLIMLGSSLLTAPLWLVIYRGLGGEVDMRAGSRIFLVTNIGKYLPGKVMHAAGRVALLQERGQSASIGVTSVLVELSLSLLGAVLLSLISIPILLRQQGMTEHLEILTAISLLALPAGLIGLHPKVMGPVLRTGSKMLPSRAGEFATTLPPYRIILLLLVAYVMLWFTMSLGLFATAHTVYPLGWETLPAMGGIAALSYLFGLAVPFAPAGIGAREGLMTVLLSTMMPAPAAAATSVLYRIITMAAESLGAGLAMLIARGR